MRYLLIIQFPESFFDSHENVTDFEKAMYGAMPRTCEVGGFDVGSGTVNFFVFTDSPLA